MTISPLPSWEDGVSSHVVGKWLKGLDLRTESGQPSTTAFNEGYVARCPRRQPGTNLLLRLAWSQDNWNPGRNVLPTGLISLELIRVANRETSVRKF